MTRIHLLIGIFLFANLAVYTQTGIRKVDFQNFTYRPSCVYEGPKTITVKKGEFSREKEMDGYTDHFYFNILAVEYGDLNGDKQDEAVVLSVCNTGGTGNFSEGFVYTMKAGEPSLLARVPGGDRADGGLRSLRVESGLLVVVANDPARAAGACCPEGTITSKLRLTGSKWTEVGKPVRQELYPKQRLTFDKGASGKTFKVTIGADDCKRYILGALAGQTLSVSVDKHDVDLRMLDDDALTTEGTGGFTAKLQRNGDFTFEVSNYGRQAR
jgi:hypothetical protein